MHWTRPLVGFPIIAINLTDDVITEIYFVYTDLSIGTHVAELLSDSKFESITGTKSAPMCQLYAGCEMHVNDLHHMRSALPTFVSEHASVASCMRALYSASYH